MLVFGDLCKKKKKKILTDKSACWMFEHSKSVQGDCSPHLASQILFYMRYLILVDTETIMRNFLCLGNYYF